MNSALVAGSFELTRLLFVGGGLLALIYKRKVGVTPGGIILPGLLAIMLYNNVLAVGLTLLLAVICWLIAEHTIYRFVLDSRMATLLVMVLSIALTLGCRAIFGLDLLHFTTVELAIPTFIIPGLFASTAHKYGLLRTGFGMLLVSAAVYLVAILLAQIIPISLLTQSSSELAHYLRFSLKNVYIVLPISLVLETVLVYFFRVRAGGYAVMPMFASYIVTAPIQGLMLLGSIALTFLVVWLVLKTTKVVGLERFVCCLFMGFICVSAMDMIASATTVPNYMTAAITPIIIIAVVANDLLIDPVKNLSLGVAPAALAASVVRWFV